MFGTISGLWIFQSTGKDFKMEMCYDGALVMPNNYAVVNEEEMTYVDGGVALPNWLVGGLINYGIGLAFGGVAAFLGAAKNQCIKAACAKTIEDTLRRELVERAVTFGIASKISGFVAASLTICGAILDPGGFLAGKWDSNDVNPNNGWCDL
ncbi:MAG: hypothetical protein MJ095_03620 [Oscillospiraceae bacterium]|nr:hypothetical protein [Oscillospiraceae bacterium]